MVSRSSNVGQVFQLPFSMSVGVSATETGDSTEESLVIRFESSDVTFRRSTLTLSTWSGLSMTVFFVTGNKADWV